MPRGGVALDIGANQGIFAYALSEIAERVIAVEPNPDYAFFARWMLRGRAEVLELAFSNEPGNATFYVPISDQGMVLHFAGSLKRTHSQFSNIKTHNVEVRRLDDFDLWTYASSKLTWRAANLRFSTVLARLSRATGQSSCSNFCQALTRTLQPARLRFAKALVTTL